MLPITSLINKPSSLVLGAVPQDWEEERKRERERKHAKGTEGVILSLLWNLILLKCPERKLQRLAVHLLAALHCLRSAGMLTV